MKSSKRIRIRRLIGINYGALSLILYTIFSNDFIECAVIIFSALIHEIGHLFAAYILGIKITGFDIDLVGASITTAGLGSYRDEIILAGAGPLANLICIVIFYPLYRYHEIHNCPFAQYFYFFCGVCLCLMVINLLPVKGFDGGRILHASLAHFFGPSIADRVCDTLTIISIGAIWVLSIYLILRFQSALSLFTFSVMLFFRIFSSKSKNNRR